MNLNIIIKDNIIRIWAILLGLYGLYISCLGIGLLLEGTTSPITLPIGLIVPGITFIGLSIFLIIRNTFPKRWATGIFLAAAAFHATFSGIYVLSLILELIVCHDVICGSI